MPCQLDDEACFPYDGAWLDSVSDVITIKDKELNLFNKMNGLESSIY